MGKASQAGYGCWERLLMLPDEAVKIPVKQKAYEGRRLSDNYVALTSRRK
jgi:hypothetical protein